MPGPHPKALITDFALHVASGKKVAEWCEKHHIPLRTAYNWHETKEFKLLVEEYRDRAIDAAIGRMADNLSNAVEYIVKLVDEGTSETVRLSAAKTVIDKLVHVQNHLKLKAEIAEIDRRLTVQEKLEMPKRPAPPAGYRPAGCWTPGAAETRRDHASTVPTARASTAHPQGMPAGSHGDRDGDGR